MGLEGGTIIDGKYEVEGRLGVGGMGVVYRARQLNLGRPVAVKVLSGDGGPRGIELDRFRREALAIARLRHPNIVTIHDFGDAPGIGVYIVLELLDGGSLGEEISRKGRLDPELAVAIARQVSAALEAAHAAGIVHRDLKPSNIFVERGTHGVTVKVLDFGIAKLRGADELTSDPITAAGAVLGTPIYMSPEQCEGSEVDERSDIYSLGCVLFEMLAGRPPFLAPSLMAALRMHTSQLPQPPSQFAPGISGALDAVVLRMLEKHPSDRFASIAEVMRALGGGEAVGGAAAATTLVDHTLGYSSEDGRTVALRSEAATRRIPTNNLQSDMTSFVGRARELADLAAMLPETRLLTLAGPGGVGKSRLALELARTALEWCDGGVWIVDLSTTTDDALVPQVVASAIGLREEVGRPIAETLVTALGERRALVVLDGCEHLVGAASALVSALVRACGGLRIVVTSREVFGLTGEVVWSVPPLGVPEDGADAAESDAVRLFVDRVRLGDREFAVDERNAGLVARICTRLDGIPLAIELAAARARVLTLEQIAEKLGDRFRLLTGGDRASLPRRQTLKATLDWSYSLLSDDERRLFERLAVFAGGCTLDAAEEAWGSGVRGQGSGKAEDGIPGSLSSPTPDPRSLTPVLDLLTRLVDKSLVVADRREGEARYRMLETIREYALERLRESGDEERVRERHAAWFVDFALRAKTEIDGPDQAIWMERLDAEYDNLRAVLRRSAERGDWVTVARVGNALFQFWGTRGYWSEGRDTVRAAVESGCDLPAPVLAGALYALGALEMRRVEYAAAEVHLERALQIRRDLGDAILAASAMRMLGTIHLRRGEIDRATALYEESLAVYREAGDEVRTAWALSGLGLAAMDAGDWDCARARMEESLALSRKAGAGRHAASAIHNLSEIMYRTGDLDRAEALASECLALSVELDDRQLTNVTHVLLANLAVERGELGRAGELYATALATSQKLGDGLVMALALEGMAAAAVAAGDAPAALARLEEAAALRAAGGFVPSLVEQAAIDATRAAAQNRER